MLIIRNEKFIKGKDGKLYLVGSSSNDLYANNIYQMGSIDILGWEVENKDEDLSKLTELDYTDKIKVHLFSDKLPLVKKIEVIKKYVKDAECLSLKFCFIDSFIACHYANKYNKKYVIESGTDAFKSTWYHGGAMFYKLIAIPYELLTKYYHHKASYIIYVSKRFLQRKYKSSAKQIGCSDTVLLNVDEEILRKRICRIDSQKRVSLGLIGASHVEYRGHDTLIEVASVLKAKGFDIEIRFLGGEKNKEKRIALAKRLGIERLVFFDGYKDKKGVFEWIDNIDILVMPTLQETLGRAVIEAMSRGCPVIGTVETALPEQIGSDCITYARNVDSIAGIIERMIEDKEYMKYCALENFYRAKKYNSTVTNEVRKQFYDQFYLENNIARK